MRVARQQMRGIRRSALPMAAAMGHSIEAGLAAVDGHGEVRARCLRAAADGFALAGMTLHSEAARLVLAPQAPSHQRSPYWHEQQNIVRPELMARAVLPVVWPDQPAGVPPPDG